MSDKYETKVRKYDLTQVNLPDRKSDINHLIKSAIICEICGETFCLQIFPQIPLIVADKSFHIRKKRMKQIHPPFVKLFKQSFI